MAGRLRLSPANFSKEYQVAQFRFPKLLGSLKQNGIYPNSQKGPNALSFAIGGTSPGLMILYTLPFKDLEHVGNDERKGSFRWIKVDLTLQKLSQRCL